MSKTTKASVSETSETAVAQAEASAASELAKREAELRRAEAELAAMKASYEAKAKAMEEREASIAAAEARAVSTAQIAAHDATTNQAAISDETALQTAPAAATGGSKWDVMKTITLPRAPKGEENYVYVNINERSFQVPRGKTQQVPLPVYERLKIMLKARDDELDYIESVPNESAPK